jgi:transposase
LRAPALPGMSKGGKAAAIFFSLIASCRRHDVDPFECLRDLFDHLPAYSSNHREDFLPDRWKQLRENQTGQ